eukprot:gene57615-biopygen9670
MFNFVDWDGSATLEGQATIVGSHRNWWDICDDCKWQSQWDVWTCPKVPPAPWKEREVAHLSVITKPPQAQISATVNIKYTNVDYSNLIGFKEVPGSASNMFNFVDWDGSATLEGQATIVGSHRNWWDICDDCKWQSQWDVWTCPKVPPAPWKEREVAHLSVITKPPQ